MTTNSKYKKRVRERMKITGEKYTVAKRAIDAASVKRTHTCTPKKPDPERCSGCADAAESAQ